MDRQQGLLIEQGLFIKELRIVQEHLKILHATISDVVTHSREGQILLSIPPLGPIQAATIIAIVGKYRQRAKKPVNSNRPSDGRAIRSQTGVSFEKTRVEQQRGAPDETDAFSHG